MDDSKFRAAILLRLDILISLLLDKMRPDEASTATEKATRLKSHGLSTSEISSIIGKTSPYVAAILAMSRKRGKRSKGKKKKASTRRR